MHEHLIPNQVVRDAAHPYRGRRPTDAGRQPSGAAPKA
jgi:hypothetical protein